MICSNAHEKRFKQMLSHFIIFGYVIDEMYCKTLSITQNKANVINNLSIYKYLTIYIYKPFRIVNYLPFSVF